MAEPRFRRFFIHTFRNLEYIILKMSRLLFSVAGVLVLSVPLQAQQFLKEAKGPLGFTEIVEKYEEFRKNNDLSKIHGWKHFKRYEHDMQMHTNGHGNPDGFGEYVNAAIQAAEEKKSGQSGYWIPAGPSTMPTNLTNYMENGIGRVNCIAFHPTDVNTFFVGVAQGGVWKTTNGGTSYTPLTDDLPITRVSNICVDPVNPSNIYISLCDFEYIGKGLYLDGRKRHTHYGLGVYKSTDGGNNWSPTGLTFQLTNGDASLIKRILINPANTSQVLACGANGMYRSNNGGSTWTKQHDSLFWDMVQDPVNPSVIYASTGWLKNNNLGYAAIYKSTNFGISWTMLNTGIPTTGVVQGIRLAIAPADPNYVYAITCDNTEGFYGMYLSTNAGSTWTYKPPEKNILEWDDGSGPGGQGTYDMAIMADATDKNKVFTGGINIWGSVNAGDTFNLVTYWKKNFGSTIHGDIHDIRRQPVSGDIFVCSDGGVYRTSDLQISNWGSPLTTSWTNLSSGMQVTSFYRLSSSKNSSARLCAGAQDNATIYKATPAGWATIFGGDGMDNYLDPYNDNLVIGSSQYGNFWRSSDNGINSNFLSTNPANESSEWVAPIVADYKNPGVLYIGNENVVKSTDGGNSWTQLAPFIADNSGSATEICALAVSPVNSKVLYAGRRVRHEIQKKGMVFKSVNGGLSFTNATANLPDSLFYTGLECAPTNSNDAVVSLAGFAAGHKVYKTINGGSSWTNISYNLPNIPVNSVKYLPGTNDLIIATDLGVYYMRSSQSSWTYYSQGLPNVIVSDIEFNQAVDRIYVSTFGRGIWSTALSALFTGIADNAVTDFRIYPNPSRGKIMISRGQVEKARIEVIDIMGRSVYRSELNRAEEEIRLTVPAGAYFIRISGNGAETVKKILIE
jgi:photosystem II stability/assembly factor-like uncharacterized protein